VISSLNWEIATASPINHNEATSGSVKVENVLHLRRVLGQTRAAKGRISETKVIGLRDGSSRNDGSSCNLSRRFRNFHDITGTPTEAVVATSAPT
jgi:hypothetical protein